MHLVYLVLEGLDQQDPKAIVVVMEHLGVLASLELKAILAYLAGPDGKEHWLVIVDSAVCDQN